MSKSVKLQKKTELQPLPLKQLKQVFKNDNSICKDNIKVTTLIPITLEQMTKITGGTPVVPDLIIRPKKDCPPPP